MAAEPAELTQYECYQLFDRTMLSILWSNKDKLDSEQIAILKLLYTDKNRGTHKTKPIIYKLSTSIPGKLGYGRYYGEKGSIETLKKDIRATLCSKYYMDIDIINCHPSLIVQMAKNWFNLSMPNLEYYNSNRSEIVSDTIAQYKMTYESVKILVLKILYNAVLDNCVPILFKEIQKEVKTFTNNLVKVKEHAQLLEYCKKNKDNIYGSYSSFIVQTEERKCLEAIVEYLKQNKYSVDVLAYDGCMIRNSDINLADIEEYVFEQTGYRISLAQKEMVPIDFEERGFMLETDDRSDIEKIYAEMKTNWEVNHFYFKPANTIVEVDPHGGLNHYTLAHATEAFNTYKLGSDSEGNDILFIRRWRHDPERRIVDKLVYKHPSECLSNEASLFQGFAYSRMKSSYDSTAVETFQNILMAICGDDKNIYTYVLKTFAHMIQKPFEKTGVCIIFSSKTQGTGKDTIMLWVSKILGNHVAHYTDDDMFWNQYDTRKEGSIMMYLEEAGSAANKAKANALKARITCDDITVNPKGLKAYTVPNIARYFMTTNEVCPVKFEESDRRFLIITPSSRLASSSTGDFGFWDNVYKHFNTDAWIWSVGTFLETLDISGWNPRQFPETEIRLLAKELVQETPERLFLLQWNGVDVPAADLYSEYKTFCIERDLRYKTSLISFGMTLTEYSSLVSRKKTNTVIVFSKI